MKPAPRQAHSLSLVSLDTAGAGPAYSTCMWLAAFSTSPVKAPDVSLEVIHHMPLATAEIDV